MTKAKSIRSIADLHPDPHNANKGTQRGRGMLEHSLHTYGAGRSVLADKHGNLIAGNKTVEVAVDIGLPIRVVQTDGKELVVVQRTDLDLDQDSAARELAIADNRVQQVSLDWDAGELLAAANELDLSKLFTKDELAEVTAGAGGAGEPVDAEPQIDKAEELRVKWGVEPGQLWQLGRIVYCPKCGKWHDV